MPQYKLSLFFPVVLLMVTLLVLSSWVGWTPIPPPLGPGEPGLLDLRNVDWAVTGPVQLYAYWEFFPGEYLPPEGLTSKRGDYVLLPGEIANQRDLYGTFRLTMKLAQGGHYSLKIPFFLSAYRLWINGVELGGVGQVGTSAETTEARYLNRTYSFTVNPGQDVEIVVHGANFTSARLLVRTPIFGPQGAVALLHDRQLARSLLFIGSILSVGLFHLIIYPLHSRASRDLLFSLLCFLVAFREMLYGEMYMATLFPHLSGPLYLRLAALTYYGGIPLFALYIHRLLPEEFSRWQAMGILVLCSPMLAALLFTSHRFYASLLWPMHGISALTFVWVSRAIYRAMRKRRSLFGYIAWGWVFLCLAAVYDIIYDVRLLAVGPLLPLGLFIFALAQSVYLSSQFSRSLEQVYHDSLTGLFNRNYLRRVGLRIFHGAQREGSLLSAIMFDIDDFKVLNDSYGHLVGDEVLQALARRAQSLLRHQDLLFRFGGEEFLILLPQANLAMALVIGERLRREIGASPLIFVGTDPLFVKVSVGVSQLSPTTPTLESLISQADGALYRAKQRGKNCVAT